MPSSTPPMTSDGQAIRDSRPRSSWPSSPARAPSHTRTGSPRLASTQSSKNPSGSAPTIGDARGLELLDERARDRPSEPHDPSLQLPDRGVVRAQARADEDQPLDQVGATQGHLAGDEAPHRVADEGRRPDPRPIQELDHIPGERVRREIASRVARAAVPAPVEGQAAARRGESGEDQAEGAPGIGVAVQQDDDLPPGATLHVMQVQFRQGDGRPTKRVGLTC